MESPHYVVPGRKPTRPGKVFCGAGKAKKRDFLQDLSAPALAIVSDAERVLDQPLTAEGKRDLHYQLRLLVLERQNEQLIMEFAAAEQRLNEVAMLKAQLATQRAELELRFKAGMPITQLILRKRHSRRQQLPCIQKKWQNWRKDAAGSNGVAPLCCAREKTN